VGTLQLFVGAGFNANPTACLPSTAIEHGFLTDFVTPAVTDQAQSDLASFLLSATPVPSVEL
jgi:hypothetical protein